MSFKFKLLGSWIIALFIGIGGYSQANFGVQFTMKLDPMNNKAVIVYFKPLVNIVDRQISQIVVSYGIPVGEKTERPAAVFTPLGVFASLVFESPQANANSSYDKTRAAFTVNSTAFYDYSYYSTSVVNNQNFDVGVEYPIAKLEFSNYPGILNNEIRLHWLPNGGVSEVSICILNTGGEDFNHYSDIFYGAGANNNPALSKTNANAYAFFLSEIIVPIQFLHFNASKDGDKANLSWTVDQTTSTKYFEIERSIDGKNFSVIAKADISPNQSQFTNTDKYLSKLNAAIAYYRIKQIDVDGKISYSVTKSIALQNSSKLQANPNPAKTFTNIRFTAPVEGKSQILVHDISGKLIAQYDQFAKKGTNSRKIELGKIAAGELLISVNVNGIAIDNIKITKIQ